MCYYSSKSDAVINLLSLLSTWFIAGRNSSTKGGHAFISTLTHEFPNLLLCLYVTLSFTFSPLLSPSCHPACHPCMPPLHFTLHFTLHVTLLSLTLLSILMSILMAPSFHQGAGEAARFHKAVPCPGGRAAGARERAGAESGVERRTQEGLQARSKYEGVCASETTSVIFAYFSCRREEEHGYNLRK